MNCRAVVRYAVCVGVLLLATAAPAMITSHTGNDAVEDHGWPAGSVEVANLKTRLGWWEGPPFGGGQFHFLYHGTTAEFQAVLGTFSSIDAPRLLLVVVQAPREDPVLQTGRRIDWEFTIWNPANWDRLHSNPLLADDPTGGFGQPVPPPTLHVYVGEEGGIDFARVFVPEKVTVQDTRATSAGYKAVEASVIRGRVCDLGSTKPLPGAEVSLWGGGQDPVRKIASATADLDGRFEMRRLPPGMYELRASAKGYVTRSLGYCQLTTNTLEDRSVLLSPSTTVSGTAVDLANQPLPGVTIRVISLIAPDGKGYRVDGPREATSDAAGHFVIADLPQGEMRLWAYDHDQTHLAADPMKPYLLPSESITLQLVATGSIQGRLVGRDGARPRIQSIRVEPVGGVKPGSWVGSRDADLDGSFEFTKVRPGRYTISPDPNLLRLQSRQPNPFAQTIEVKSGETTEVTLESPGR